MHITHMLMLLQACIALMGLSTVYAVKNLALNKDARQSSLGDSLGKASGAVDGNHDRTYSSGSCTHTSDQTGKDRPWWTVDLGANYSVYQVEITNREYHESRLHNFNIRVLMGFDANPGTSNQSDVCYHVSGAQRKKPPVLYDCNTPIVGRHVKIELLDPGILSLCEVKVFGDVAKCDLNTDICSENAECVKTPGSYICICFTGFNGDGFTCAASVFGTIGVVILLIGLCLCSLWKHRKRRLRIKRSRNDRIELKPTGKSALEIGSLLKRILDPETQKTIHSMLIHPDKIEKTTQIGKGTFGTVYYGRYRPDKNPLHVQEVAIKSLKDSSCIYPEINALMQEAIFMADFSHPNILNILGICVDPRVGIPALVLPFMLHGDLQKYLRSFRYDDDKVDKTPGLVQLLSFSLQIARGMEYLSNQKFVHRDLAARNCMLNDQMLLKVADFDLGRDIYCRSYYRQDKHKLLPVKWMAIESFEDRIFSTCTDVWSYGVTLCEIFTLGKIPYPNLENEDVLAALKDGQRLTKPDTCPDKLFEIIQRCWMTNPKERPTFTELVKVVDGALTGMSDYLDLDGSSAANAMDLTTGVVSSPRGLAIKDRGEILYATSD